ncbi:unnamed protein product, partial [Ranitomeya imitator]
PPGIYYLYFSKRHDLSVSKELRVFYLILQCIFSISTFTVLEIMFVSVTVPKLLAILIHTEKTISFFALYAFNALVETECFLLSLMVFDRHLACKQSVTLLYISTIMNSLL